MAKPRNTKSTSKTRSKGVAAKTTKARTRVKTPGGVAVAAKAKPAPKVSAKPKAKAKTQPQARQQTSRKAQPKVQAQAKSQAKSSAQPTPANRAPEDDEAFDGADAYTDTNSSSPSGPDLSAILDRLADNYFDNGRANRQRGSRSGVQSNGSENSFASANGDGDGNGNDNTRPKLGMNGDENYLDFLGRVFDNMNEGSWDADQFDEMTQGVGMVLGTGPAFAMMESMFATVNAQSAVLMNAVQTQRQLDQVALCCTSACVKQLLNMNNDQNSE